MEKEEPFDYYKETALRLGIKEENLVEQILYGASKITSLEPGANKKDFEELKLFHTNENNINQVIPNFPINNKIIVYQTNSPQLTYCSKKNPKSSHILIAGETLDIDGEKISQKLLSKLNECSSSKYFFTLSNKGFVMIEIKDNIIIKSETYKESCPRERFELGIDYKSALEWMIKEYIGIE